MDPSHFITLRDKLLHAEKFSDVWEYFLDHISDDPEFNVASHRTRSEVLEPIFDQFCSHALKAKPAHGSLLLVRYGPNHFIHGGAMVGTMLVNVLFFEDLMTGLFSVTDPTGRRPARLSRFNAKPAPGMPNPTQN